jgi:hypothetical protein
MTLVPTSQRPRYGSRIIGVPRPSEVPLRRFDVVALDIVSGFPTTKQVSMPSSYLQIV